MNRNRTRFRLRYLVLLAAIVILITIARAHRVDNQIQHRVDQVNPRPSATVTLHVVGGG